ncbi:MAG: ABC transporter ATP-binding protein [bacterium]
MNAQPIESAESPPDRTNPSSKNKPVIKARELEVTFGRGFFGGEVQALNGCNLTVDKGDIYGILGPNGAGKTTAMNCLLGLIKPDDGNLEVLDREPQHGDDLFNDVGYVPEEPNYHLYLTVEEALKFYGHLYNDDIPSKRFEEVLKKLDIYDQRDLRLKYCSKGMKQKVGLATCMVKQPDLLLLDEPTRGLDPVVVKTFRNELLRLNEEGTTIVINSHVLSEVELICERVAILQNGSVIKEDRLDVITDHERKSYRVALEVTSDLENNCLPDYLDMDKRDEDRLEGLIPINMVENFFGFTNNHDITVLECSLSQPSLEDIFVDLVSEEEDDETAGA